MLFWFVQKTAIFKVNNFITVSSKKLHWVTLTVTLAEVGLLLADVKFAPVCGSPSSRQALPPPGVSSGDQKRQQSCRIRLLASHRSLPQTNSCSHTSVGESYEHWPVRLILAERHRNSPWVLPDASRVHDSLQLFRVHSKQLYGFTLSAATVAFKIAFSVSPIVSTVTLHNTRNF